MRTPTRFHVAGCVFLLACATLVAQDCPPETFDYDYGPPCSYGNVAAMVMNHYGPDGPVVPLGADYARACRDVGLIRAAVPVLVDHTQLWPEHYLILYTPSPFDPQLVCTNQYYGATMTRSYSWWFVQFPTAVNIPALVEIYGRLPGVYAHADSFLCPASACCAFPRWLYIEQADGTWRWSISENARDPTAESWSIEVSEEGSVAVIVDDFNDGDDNGWTHVDFTSGFPYGPGVFEASSGGYRLSTPGSVPFNGAASLIATWDASADWFYANGCVRAKIRSESPNSNVFIATRATSEGDGCFYGGMPSTGQFFIQAGPEAAVFAGISGQLFDLNQDWVLEACEIDDLLTLKAWRDGEPEPGEPLISVRHTTYSAGLIGVGGVHESGVASPISVAFDDISFIPPQESGRPSWSGLGTGMDGTVRALAVLANGGLVAGGDFTTAGGVPANGIARWDGCGWSAVGTGVDGIIRALAELPNGDLLVGGRFTIAGGAPAGNIARWDGSAWSPLGTGVAGDWWTSVYALAVLPDGGIVAGGWFDTAGGVPANNIARWDGSGWSPLGVGLEGFACSAPVSALAVLPNGDLVAGGNFTSAGGAPMEAIARWDGSAWSALGTGIADGYGYSVVSALAVLPNGDLVAGGGFWKVGGIPASNIARWDGTQWQALGGGLTRVLERCGAIGWCDGAQPVVRALAIDNDQLIVGGQLTTAGGGSANNIARWNGMAWSPLWTGTGGTVLALAVLPNGDLVAGGFFTRAGSDFSSNYIARWGFPEQDTNDDGMLDVCDNCPDVANFHQFDTDADGVGDACDACAGSNLHATIVIGDCDTGIPNQTLDDGCTMADWIALAAGAATNHGAFASSVAHLGNDWKKAGLITAEEKDRLQQCTAGAR